MHKQIKIAPGVYVVDYRKNAQLKGIDTHSVAEVKDIGLMLDKISNLESKINQLLYSNSAIQEEQNYDTDQVLLEALQGNFQLMLKFSNEMKQLILELNAVKYKPETDKIQLLLNPVRISDRQKEIETKFNAFLAQFGKQTVKQNSDQQQQKILAQVGEPKGKEENQKKQQNIEQKKVEKQEEGIYL